MHRRLSRSSLALCLLAAALGCGGAQEQASAPVASALDRAADLEGVPRALLTAMAWVDSRGSMNQGLPSADGAYGLLHLVDRAGLDVEAHPQSLLRAARLTGLAPEALRTDALANARGGAALLRAEQERLLATYPDLREDRLGDWYPAVMRLSGAQAPLVADSYAAQVYRLLRDGLAVDAFDGGPLRIAPQEFDLRGRAVSGALDTSQAGEYCPGGACVAFVPAASSNFAVGRGGLPVTTIVIHDMEGYYQSSIDWFANPTAGVSAHYCIRSSDGQVTQQVLDADTAWHAGNHNVNAQAIGIEHEGFAHAGTQWYTEAMYQSSAALVRWLTDTLAIPRDRTHIIGHYEVPNLNHAGWYGGANAHHDPCDTWNGDPTWHNTSACYWDWTHYFDLINGTSGGGGGGANGTLTGVVADACCGLGATARKPLAGALVVLEGTALSATTDSTGTYKFSLAPGTYTPQASLGGYVTGDHTSAGTGLAAAVAVASNQTSWGSILLAQTPPPPATGLYGVVSGPQGHLAAARITLQPGGANATSDSLGAYSILVPSGDYQLVCDAVGFTRLSQAVTIGAGKLQLDLALVPSVAPQVHIDAPLDGAVVATSTVTIAGVANVPGLTTLTVGGASATADAHGGFSVEVHLAPGSNVVEVVATDSAGHSVKGTVTIEYDAPAEPVAPSLKASGCGAAGLPGPLLLAGLLPLLFRRRRR